MTPEEFQAAQERNAQAAAEAQARREAAQAENQRLLDARKNGRTFERKEQPTPYTLNMEKRAQEQAERQAAEQARIAALNPRDVWFSTLSWQEQQRVIKWQAANKGLLYPMPAGFTVEAKGV